VVSSITIDVVSSGIVNVVVRSIVVGVRIVVGY
jgi:hypothetical protein